MKNGVAGRDGKCLMQLRHRKLLCWFHLFSFFAVHWLGRHAQATQVHSHRSVAGTHTANICPASTRMHHTPEQEQATYHQFPPRGYFLPLTGTNIGISVKSVESFDLGAAGVTHVACQAHLSIRMDTSLSDLHLI